MPLYDCLFKQDSPNGQKALAQVDNLRVGDVIEERLMPAIPETVKWTCIEAIRNQGGGTGSIVTLAGRWCDMPLYTLEIKTEGKDISMKVRNV
jgi:hypothetical protein